MSPATDQERVNLQSTLAILQRRLALLEEQAARLGYRTDPATNMEIADLRGKVAEIEELLKPPKALSPEIWQTMGPDDRMLYITNLVLTLNADFESFYRRIMRRVWWAAALTIGAVLLIDGAAIAAIYWIIVLH